MRCRKTFGAGTGAGLLSPTACAPWPPAWRRCPQTAARRCRPLPPRALPGHHRPPSPSCRARRRRWRTALLRPPLPARGAALRIAGRVCGRRRRRPAGWAFGALGLQGPRPPPATLYLNDLADVLRDAVDPRFEFVRYAESLAGSQPTFDPLAMRWPRRQPGGRHAAGADAGRAVARHQPTVVLLSVPFPGAVYAAFRIAQTIKAQHPQIVTVLGGGFVNTELRELATRACSTFFDYVTLDAGDARCWRCWNTWPAARPASGWCAPLRGTRRRYATSTWPSRRGVCRGGHPTWDGLPLDRYLSLLDMLNPMHRLWATGAGTNSPWRTAATGRSAASAT